MVALTHDLADVSRIIAYHENKVSSGIAECLLAANMPLSSVDLSSRQKKWYMVNRCTLNANIKLPCLHAILGFHPLDGRLSNAQFSEIAERYMDLIGFGHQPFLVYRHTDTFHPHLHIVSTNIRSDGSQIYTHRLGQRLSFPAAKRLEDDFGLVSAMAYARDQQERPLPRKELLQAGQPLTKALRDILLYLQETYSFSDLQEWNALLRPFNILALSPRDCPGEAKKGLIYYMTDKCQRAISKGIPGSHLSPGLRSPNPYSLKDSPGALTSRSRIRTILQRELENSGNRENSLADRLRRQGIELVESPGKPKGPCEIVVVDHLMRCALHENRLGLDISALRMGQREESTSVKKHKVPTHWSLKL